MAVMSSRNLNSRVLPLVAALISIVFAVAVLCGWIFDITWLRAPFADQVSTKVNTALCFLVCGALLLIALRPRSLSREVLRWFGVAFLLAIAAGTLVQYFLGVDLGVDHFFVDAPDRSPFTTSPGRMAPTSAIGFALFALALLFNRWETGWARVTSRTLLTFVLLLAVTSIMGYAYGAPELYLGIDGVTAMALTTAIVFSAVSLGGIWLRSSYGFPAMLAEQSMVGTHIRALLPMIVAAPLLVGAAVSAGYGRLYEGPFAIALVSLGSVLAAGLVASVSIVVLRRADNALFMRERALAASRNGVVITDHCAPDEPIVYVNQAFSEITGYSEGEALGRNCRFLNARVDVDEAMLYRIRECLKNGHSDTVELENARKDGTRFWNRLTLAPVTDYEGTITHFVGVVDDISFRRKQEKRLAVALEKAKAAIEMRDTFARLISHELRTPLNSALTWTRLMEVDNSPETVESGLAIVAQSIESQSRLIDDLVDVSRFASAGVRLEQGPVDFRELVETAVEGLRPSIEPGLTLRCQFADADYAANLDAERVRQIVRNLVNNAGKYTPQGGRVEVSVGVVDGMLELTVKDTGRGLTGEQIERVFEPFWRASENTPGLGVGLAIVSSLVAAHDGEISVRSDGVDQGCTFSVRLPRNPEPKKRVPLQGEKADIRSEA